MSEAAARAALEIDNNSGPVDPDADSVVSLVQSSDSAYAAFAAAKATAAAATIATTATTAYDVAGARAAAYAAAAHAGYAAATGVPEFTASAISAAWNSVSADATALEEGITPKILATSRLWRGDVPRTAIDARNKFNLFLLATRADLFTADQALLLTNEGWTVWTDWYQDRLDGEVPNIDLQEARVLIDADLWDQGPKAVNAEIARLIEEHTLPLPAPETAGEQRTSGYNFGGAADGRIELVDPSQAGDARDDEIGREFHGEVRSAALELQDRCRRSNQLYVLGESIRKYLDRLGNSPREVKRSLILYGEVLRNLRDADLRLQEAKDPLPEPIPEDAFAVLQTHIAAHNQYVSTDPALASYSRALMDPEDFASVVVMPDETLEALNDLAPILDGAAQEALHDAAQAAKHNTPAGRRALVWLNQSWRNLAIETSRQVLYTLRKSAEAFYDEAVIATKLTTEQAIVATREFAAVALQRVKHGAIAYVAIEVGPPAIQALGDFIGPSTGAYVAETLGAAFTGAAVTVSQIVMLAIFARFAIKSEWFLKQIDNDDVRRVLEALRIK